MKHQLFKRGTYVQVDIGKSHLEVVGKVKDSTIKTIRITGADAFNIPQQAIEVEMKMLTVPENPELEPRLLDDPAFISEVINDFNGIVLKDGKLYVSIYDIGTPATELKQLFFNLIKEPD